jgi:hypothetical protein
MAQPEAESSRAGADPAQVPHWETRMSESGELTATLVGIGRPITVSAHDVDALRKKVRDVVMRGML